MPQAQNGQLAEVQLRAIAPDVVFDGGDLDCGSGLVLMIRESMLRVINRGRYSC